MKKITLIIIGVLAMLLSVGCTNSDEAIIKQVTTEYIEFNKNIKNAFADDGADSETSKGKSKELNDKEQDEALFINMLTENLKGYEKDISYDIKQVDIVNDTAKVLVDFKYLDLNQATQNTMDRVEVLAFELLSKNGGEYSNEELFDSIGKAFRADIDATISAYSKQYTDTTIPFELVKTDKGWIVSEENQEVIDQFVNVITFNAMGTIESSLNNYAEFDNEDMNDIKEVKIGENFILNNDIVSINNVEKRIGDNDTLYVVLDLSWTNKSKQVASWESDIWSEEGINVIAFQDGIEVQQVAPISEDVYNNLLKIKPDVTVDNIKLVFEVRNKKQIDVEFRGATGEMAKISLDFPY